MRSRTIGSILLAASFAIGTSSVSGAIDPGTDPKGWLTALDKASVATEGWAVEHLRIDFGTAHLDIDSGTLVPVRGPAPRTQEFIFFGTARFVLATDDPVEAYQVELFTGTERLNEPVTRAVLAIASDGVIDGLIGRPGSARLTPDQSRRSIDLLASWRASREYRRSGLRLQALADAVGDSSAQRFAAAWCDAPRLGRFLLRVDPEADAPLKIEQFVPLRLGDADKDSWRSWLRGEQFVGRQLDVEVDDYGTWDVWYAGKLDSADGNPRTGHSSFEPEHYDLAADVDTDVVSLDGRATLSLVGRTDGARVVRLSLFPDLEVDAITLRGGPALPWARSKSTIVAVLPTSAAAGSKFDLEVRYHGVLFQRVEKNSIVKRTTTSWYPHAGTVDLATYRAVFETPARHTLLGSGRVVEEMRIKKYRRQVRVLDKPSQFFGFELGKYKIVKRQLGHVALTIGFLGDWGAASEAEKDATIGTIWDALATHEENFGPYPLDHLSVATTRHGFGQGFLGFVTIPDDFVRRIEESRPAALDHRRLIAHELAHQWWGSLVGWKSDRDVWLSESIANYAAIFFRRKTAKATEQEGSSEILDLMATRDFSRTTIVERPVEAMGPITLGRRLDSSLSSKAYRAIVYQKGAKVLAMLAEQLGETQFLEMLKEIALRADFRPLDTETVMSALAKMSGQSLDAFTRSFVHGIGYPEIYYEYAVEPAPDGFTLRGTVHQVSRGFRRDRLVRADGGGFDVVPTFHEYQATDDAQILIPCVLPAMGAELSRRVRIVLHASGPETPFQFDVPFRPTMLRADPRATLPTSTFDLTLKPKTSLAAWAVALRSTGRNDEARAIYRSALALRSDAASGRFQTLSEGESVRRTDAENGWIHLDLADMAVDDGLFEDAAAELEDRTVSLISPLGSAGAFRRKLLLARLAIHSGDAETAYKLSSGLLKLGILQKESDSIVDLWRRDALSAGRSGFARDYLVYAAAAHATGREQVCREAAAAAKRRGADASLLDELHRGAR